ncbi:MAG: citrate lyase acyl carrier protein [Marinifilaceae bacterium]|jgi:citrate lyase subunit gamma (acyl carrier protein)|nr:citrate lyase acyl carrier protein [Marinifilaceae bacterium]
MIPKNKAQAGTFESGDIMILLEPIEENRNEIDLSSNVLLQFEDDIRNVINTVLDKYEITNVRVIAKDKGALTPTIEARVETAVKRSLGIQEGTLQ